MCEIPADTSDPFLRQAIEEIDARLLERTAGGEDLLSLLRHMMEPPFPQPEHACRLAGAVAAQSPSALDFLWTLYTAASGAAAEAARRELAALAAKPKSAAVVNELDQLMDLTDDPARRDVLRAIQSSDIRQGGA